MNIGMVLNNALTELTSPHATHASAAAYHTNYYVQRVPFIWNSCLEYENNKSPFNECNKYNKHTHKE